jgi:hypothetical protein
MPDIDEPDSISENIMSNFLTQWSLPAIAAIALTACGGGSNPSGEGRLSISGTPSPTAQVGHVWTFQPTIHSPDGESYELTVENIPPWMSILPNPWELSGEPLPEDADTHWAHIVVKASDGRTIARLPAFHINVIAQDAATGTAFLRWLPPAARANGSPIGKLGGYRVLYGQISGSYSRVIAIDNPGITSYLIEDLGPGTWYFALVAVTSDGLASAPSAEVSKRI